MEIDEKLILAMLAGARAIRQNKRLQGVTFCYDVFGEFGGPKEINYCEAAKLLYDTAQAELEAPNA